MTGPNYPSADFFQQAMHIICGTPDIRLMLRKTLDFLSRYIEIDALALSVFEEDISSVRRFALCTKDGKEEGESLERLPDPIFRCAQKIIRKTTDFVLTESAQDNPVRAYMSECGRSRYQSAIVLHLHQEEHYIGFVDVFAARPHVFSREDAVLVNKLAAPFSLYLINFLHFRALREKQRRQMCGARCRNKAGAPFVGFFSGLSQVRRMADDVAATTTPVLITGETGTGKEVIADYIQRCSDRADRPFIKVNCAAIPEHLLESEFFGHEANAFTGAGRMKKGRFERAHTGTLFLDEIGDLPENMQSKLLRVLEYKEMERLGGTSPLQLDVRIIAATNQSLPSRVQEGSFRRDLYYRLNVFPLHLPPLRERMEDIPELTAYFLDQKQKELGLPATLLPSEAEMRQLLRHDWPGNVRELANVVERALISAKHSGVVRFCPDGSGNPPPDRESPAGERTEHFLARRPASEKNRLPDFGEEFPLVPLETLEREYILHVLRRANGKIMGKNSAAELLGLNGYTLRKRMLKLGIDPKKRHEILFPKS